MLSSRAAKLGTPLRLAAAGLALLLATAPAAAQGSGGASSDASTRQMQQELQQVGQKVIQLRQQALQDSAIQSEQDKLQVEIQTKMVSIDSATTQRLDRIKAITQEFQQAQQSQDTAKIQSLMAEYQQLTQKNQAVEMQAMQDSELAAELDSFRTNLIQRMNAIDPKADSLISRLQALQAELQGQAQDTSESGRR